MRLVYTLRLNWYVHSEQTVQERGCSLSSSDCLLIVYQGTSFSPALTVCTLFTSAPGPLASADCLLIVYQCTR